MSLESLKVLEPCFVLPRTTLQVELTHVELHGSNCTGCFFYCARSGLIMELQDAVHFVTLTFSSVQIMKPPAYTSETQ